MSRLSAAAVACALLLSGCSLLGNGTPAPAASTAPPAAANPRLLALADLPAGYRSVPVPADGAGGSLGGCPALDAQPSAATATAEALFTRAGSADTVAETLSDTTPADAKATLDTLGTAVSGCTSFTASVSGVKLPFTTTRLAVPLIGEQRTGVRMVATVGAGLTIEEDIAGVRRGGTLILVVFVSTGALDPAFVASTIGAADRRIASG